MKRRTIQTILATLALIAMAAAAKAEPDATQALRLTVELRDGSCIIGEPAVIVIPLHTVFGKIEMPLAHVVSIAFDDDNERVTVIMRNSDRISGAHGLEHLKLTTVFGDVTIDTAHLAHVHVKEAP